MLRDHLKYIWCGLQDAFKWNLVVSIVLNDAELRRYVLQSIVLNSLSLALIYIVDFFFLPLVRYRWDLAHENTSWMSRVIWCLPCITVSLYLNNVWCSTIAQRAYLLKHGSGASALLHNFPGSSAGILSALFNSSYRVIMIMICLVSSFVLSYIPYLGSPMSYIYLCWIDAYYCFEFVWVAKGMSLAKRTRHLEERWPYFLAFGLPVTILCSWGTILTNAVSFALVFPAYIILAMHANPVPFDTYSPASFHHGVVKTPRLPIFAPVLWLNDGIMRILIGRLHGLPTAHLSSSTRGEPYDADSAIIAEEGTQAGVGVLNYQSSPHRQVTETIAIRRKLD